MHSSNVYFCFLSGPRIQRSQSVRHNPSPDNNNSPGRWTWETGESFNQIQMYILLKTLFSHPPPHTTHLKLNITITIIMTIAKFWRGIIYFCHDIFLWTSHKISLITSFPSVHHCTAGSFSATRTSLSWLLTWTVSCQGNQWTWLTCAEPCLT